MSNVIKVIEPNEAFYKNHVTFTSVGDIQSLVKTFLKDTGFNYFTFDRGYFDGSHIKLTNAGKWIEHYYKKKLYNTCLWDTSPKFFSDSHIFWSWLKNDPVYVEAALHNISNGLTIIRPHKSYCDFYNFGSTNDNISPLQNIIFSLNHLYRFIALFNDKAHKLIVQAENNRFILPIQKQKELKIENITKFDNSNLDNITHLYLGDEFDNCYLTKKELQIIQKLMMGKRLVDIAKLLFISEKTIETHISNIKNKLKCNTIFELGFIASKLGMDKLLNPKLLK